MHLLSSRIALIAFTWTFLCGLLSAGEIEKAAIIKLNQTMESGSVDASTYLERGELYRLDTEYRLALKDFATAEGLDPDLSEVHLARARVYVDINRNEQTEANLLRFLELEPTNLKGLRLLASLYAQQERFREADVIYSRIIDTFDTPPVSFYLIRSRNREAYDDLEGALDIIKEAIQAAEWTPMLESRALEYEIKLGQYEAALARLDQLAEKEARQAFRHYQKKAEVYLLMEDSGAAKENYRLALASLDSLYPSLANLPGMKAFREALLESLKNLE